MSERAGVRVLSHRGFQEIYLTLCPDADAMPSRTFARAAEILSGQGVQPILERVFGPQSDRADLIRARAQAWTEHGLDPGLPFAYLDGSPPGGGGFSGLQVWGVIPDDAGALPVRSSDVAGPIARVWSGPGFRLLHLPLVRGTTADGALAAGATRQAEQMFARATEALSAHGFGWTHVVRTWIYLARLLDWYGEFNRIRTAYYQDHGLGTEGGAFPASTGILGRSLDEECCLSLLAVAPTSGPVSVRSVAASARQPAAITYGSAFARAVALSLGSRRTIHVSGTASIDGRGHTLHPWNAEAQSVETLLCLAALLEEQGAGLEDIRMATLYCKNAAALAAYRNVVRLLRLPEFPTLALRADICRSELLVEMEAVAVTEQRGP